MQNALNSSSAPGQNPIWTRFKPFIGGAGVLLLLVLLSMWGGVPHGKTTEFWLGVGMLVLILGGWLLVGWHLLFRALPVGQRVPQPLTLNMSLRQLMSILLGLCGITLIVAAFWDEVWHRKYGIPFGEDFFWNPHLLIYFGLGTTILMGCTGLYLLMRTGRGTFQQRFRANPLFAFLALISALLLYVLPADPLWHSIYGEDLSALSLPHLLLLVGFELIILTTVAIYCSTLPQREWRGIHRLRVEDLLPLVVLSFGLNEFLQLITTDWDGLREINPAVLTRPEWLLPVCLILTAGFMGVLTNHTLRRVGSATVIGVIAFAVRSFLMSLFNYPEMSADSWIICLAPLVAIDLWYAGNLALRQRIPPAFTAGLTGSIGLILAFPLINTLFLYPHVDGGNLVSMSLAVLIMGIFAGALGGQIGDYLANSNKQVEPATAAAARLPWITAGALLVMVIFLIVFITTSVPPTA